MFYVSCQLLLSHFKLEIRKLYCIALSDSDRDFCLEDKLISTLDRKYYNQENTGIILEVWSIVFLTYSK